MGYQIYGFVLIPVLSRLNWKISKLPFLNFGGFSTMERHESWKVRLMNEQGWLLSDKLSNSS